MRGKSNNKTSLGEVRFSVVSHAEWIPGSAGDLPMPAMLRRRGSVPGKMALDAAFRCLAESTSGIPALFCSRHGECERSAELLSDLVRDNPISPTSFSLSVHNATGGLFSIARRDHSNSLAIAAGHSTIEHAVIEACGLLADDAPAVLLVAYDNYLPVIFKAFQDCNVLPYAWAWMMQLPRENTPGISLSWSASGEYEIHPESPGIEIFRFFIQKMPLLERICNNKRWQWKFHDKI